MSQNITPVGSFKCKTVKTVKTVKNTVLCITSFFTFLRRIQTDTPAWLKLPYNPPTNSSTSPSCESPRPPSDMLSQTPSQKKSSAPRPTRQSTNLPSGPFDGQPTRGLPMCTKPTNSSGATLREETKAESERRDIVASAKDRDEHAPVLTCRATQTCASLITPSPSRSPSLPSWARARRSLPTCRRLSSQRQWRTAPSSPWQRSCPPQACPQ